jgi:hypothetical protein
MLEQAVVQAASRLVKCSYRVRGGRATQGDLQAIALGESTFAGIFPSLSKADMMKLAHLIVDISSWSLRHLLNIPNAVPAGVTPEGWSPDRLEIEPVDPTTHVFRKDGSAVPFHVIIPEILGDRELTALEVLAGFDERKLRYLPSRRAGHSKGLVQTLRNALRRLPYVVPATYEGGRITFLLDQLAVPQKPVPPRDINRARSR